MAPPGPGLARFVIHSVNIRSSSAHQGPGIALVWGIEMNKETRSLCSGLNGDPNAPKVMSTSDSPEPVNVTFF